VTLFAQALEGALSQEEDIGEAACAPALPGLDAILTALPREAPPDRRPLWAQELDLPLACDGDDVRRAFRRLARKTHPDCHGGSHEAFLRAVEARDEALATVRETPARPESRAFATGQPQPPARSVYA